MNLPFAEPWSWSRRRWGWTIGTILAAEVFFSWYLSDRSLPLLRHRLIPARLRLVLDPVANQQLSEELVTSDPTLFALPNAHNFSGRAWLNLPAWSHHARDWVVTDPGLTNYSQPPAGYQLEPKDWVDTDPGLALDTERLGTGIAQYVKARITPSLLVSDKPTPILLDLSVPSEPVITQSVVRVEGPLAQRPLISPLTLPVWPCSEVLQNSVVRVAVNAEGETFSPRLQSGSGLASADQAALRLAKSARFAPLPLEASPKTSGPLHLSWGDLVFQWCTTNLPPTPPKP